jgi:23S rRNA pseudouridine2605 synthase
MFKKKAVKEQPANEEMRLQKIISRAGIASRRHAEQLILTGQVTVNGKMVTELGTKAVPGRDHIKVAGKLLHEPAELVYLALHKPDAVVSTLLDPEGRPSLADLLERAPERVYPIGRLPFHGSGLLLLTNDGELANQLLHSNKIMQTWWVKVKGELTREQTEELDQRIGVKLQRVRAGDNAWYEARLRNIRDDTLRSALAEAGHPMEKLKRVRLGRIELGMLPVGAWRPLNQQEISEMRRMAGNGAKGMAEKPPTKLMPGKDAGVSRDARKAILGPAAAVVLSARKPRPEQGPKSKPSIRKPWLAHSSKPVHGGAGKSWQGRPGSGAQGGSKPWPRRNASEPQGGRPQREGNDWRDNRIASPNGPHKQWPRKNASAPHEGRPWSGKAAAAPHRGGNQQSSKQWRPDSDRPLQSGRKEWPRKNAGASQGGRGQWRGNNASAVDGTRKQWPKKNNSIPPGGRAWPEPPAAEGVKTDPPWRGKRDNRHGVAQGKGPAQAFRMFHPTGQGVHQPDKQDSATPKQSAPIYDRWKRGTHQNEAGTTASHKPTSWARKPLPLGKESHDE